MSYSSTFKLRAESGIPAVKLMRAIDKAFPHNEGIKVETETGDSWNLEDLIDLDQSLIVSARTEYYDTSWYDAKKDFAAISAEFPDVLLTVDFEGEEQGDVARWFFRGGQLEEHTPGSWKPPKTPERV